MLKQMSKGFPKRSSNQVLPFSLEFLRDANPSCNTAQKAESRKPSLRKDLGSRWE